MQRNGWSLRRPTAQIYSLTLTSFDQLTIVLTATLASIGTVATGGELHLPEPTFLSEKLLAEARAALRTEEPAARL